ncbi:hypothetical protein ACFPRL_29545 [Pseudoclavibacter helvolus]
MTWSDSRISSRTSARRSSGNMLTTSLRRASGRSRSAVAKSLGFISEWAVRNCVAACCSPIVSSGVTSPQVAKRVGPVPKSCLLLRGSLTKSWPTLQFPWASSSICTSSIVPEAVPSLNVTDRSARSARTRTS